MRGSGEGVEGKSIGEDWSHTSLAEGNSSIDVGAWSKDSGSKEGSTLGLGYYSAGVRGELVTGMKGKA